MSRLIQPLIDIFDFNTMTVSLVLADLDNEDAGRRMRQGEGSSITFLTGHLISTRHVMLQLVGAADDNPYLETFGTDAKPRDAEDYPDISELKSVWDGLTERFGSALTEAGDELLLSEPPSRYPVPDNTVRGALMFLAWHESYHVGQIGILRTELGYPAVRDVLIRQAAGQA